MSKQVKAIVKVMTRKVKGSFVKAKFKTKVQLIVGTIAIGTVLTIGIVYAAGAEERAEIKAIAKAKAQEVQLMRDKTQAAIEAEEAARKMVLFNAEQTVEEVIKEGEFTALKIEFETVAEKDSDHSNAITKWWGKNILKVNIPYTVRYMIDMSDIYMLVDSNGVVNVSIDERDLYLSIEQGQYTEMTPEKTEQGLFPAEFNSSETLALVNAKRNEIIEVYSQNIGNICEAVENIKSQIETVAQKFGSEVKFAEDTAFEGITKVIENTEDKGDK